MLSINAMLIKTLGNAGMQQPEEFFAYAAKGTSDVCCPASVDVQISLEHAEDTGNSGNLAKHNDITMTKNVISSHGM